MNDVFIIAEPFPLAYSLPYHFTLYPGNGKRNGPRPADLPTATAFAKDDVRTYAAWNPTGRAVTVTFSDGGQLAVPLGKIATREKQ